MTSLMRKLFVTTVSMMILAFAATCAPAKEIKIGAAEDGKKVEVQQGKLLTITLDSNPSTGYTWEVTQSGDPLLKQKGEALFTQSAGSEKVVGAGGTQTFRFETTGTGETTLKLIYHRSWEKDVEPLQIYTVTVAVK